MLGLFDVAGCKVLLLRKNKVHCPKAFSRAFEKKGPDCVPPTLRCANQSKSSRGGTLH